MDGLESPVLGNPDNGTSSSNMSTNPASGTSSSSITASGTSSSTISIGGVNDSDPGILVDVLVLWLEGVLSLEEGLLSLSVEREELLPSDSLVL